MDAGTVEIWPEHQAAYRLFLRLRTQWRVGMAGATGLDYRVLFRLMDNLTLSGEAFDALLDEIQIMEAEALSVMHKKTTDSK